MSWASRRKFIYFVGFVFIFAVLIGIPTYAYFHRTATCFDNKQNQNEEGVDCGGPCSNVCAASALSPIILWQQSFEVVPGTFTAVAYIENPNIKAESFGVPYTFTFYNSDNTVLGKRTGVMDIPAGKNFAVTETNLSFNGKIPARTLFEFNSDISWKVSRNLPDLIVKNILVSNPGTSPEITADIENPNLTQVGKVGVTALVYDTDGNAFAASHTVIPAFNRQATQHITFTWPQAFTHQISHVEIIPVIQ